MKPYFVGRGPTARQLLALGGLLGALFVGALILFGANPAGVRAGSGPAYLPVQFKPQPTPEPGPPPQFLQNIELPGASCPNNAAFNPFSGLLYVTNNFSNNVSVFQDRLHLGDIPTGKWPSGVAVDPLSSRAWVANLHSGTSVLDGTNQIAFVPPAYEPYGVAYNPVNGLVYVTDLDSKVQIIRDSAVVTTLELVDPITGKGAGWMRPVLVDPRTGLVYAASWDYGHLYVIRDTQVIATARVGWGPLNMALDEARGLLYIAHSEPSPDFPHDISVVDLATLQVTFINTTPGAINRARDVAVDWRRGLAYVTNPDTDNVTVLRGTQVLGKLGVGDRPWGIGINPKDGTVFVTNRASGTLSILRDGGVLETVPVFGKEPFAIGVDTDNDDIYVINRGVEKAGSDGCRQASVSIFH